MLLVYLIERTFYRQFPIMGFAVPEISFTLVPHFLTSLVFMVLVLPRYLFASPAPMDKDKIFAALAQKGISRREAQIIEMLAEGCRSKEICERLFISDYTVRTHIKNIYKKMSVGNRVQLLNRLRQG